jgi:formate dehydrogenase
VASGKRIKYKDILRHEHGWMYGKKEYGHIARVLRTSDKTVHCAPPRFLFALRQELENRRSPTSAEFPMLLVNRRVRESMNSWLNETPGLFEQFRGNVAELHPDDAASLGLESGQWARVSSDSGSIELPVVIAQGGRPGVVAIPHGWGSRVFDPGGSAPPEALGSNRNLLIGRSVIDPLSQTPSLNATPVRVEALRKETRTQPATAASGVA